MPEESFVTQVFVLMLPMDAVWRERILLALGGRGIAQCCIVIKAFAGLLPIGGLHPYFGWRKPYFLNFHHSRLRISADIFDEE